MISFPLKRRDIFPYDMKKLLSSMFKIKQKNESNWLAEMEMKRDYWLNGPQWHCRKTKQAKIQNDWAGEI